jgi:hypothetical protein
MCAVRQTGGQAGRQAGMQALGRLGCGGGAGGSFFFFKTRWLLVYSNIRPAGLPRPHALRPTARRVVGRAPSPL